jgi:hypothetical protein
MSAQVSAGVGPETRNPTPETYIGGYGDPPYELKKYITEQAYPSFRPRCKECIRMLKGPKKKLETKLPNRERGWQIAEEIEEYGAET